MILQDLQLIVDQSKGSSEPLYLRNLLKETLQLYTLNFIYGSRWGKDFLFKGGTCLRVCFDLPRLSEDLDFDIKNYPKFKLEEFLEEIKDYFSTKWQLRNFSTRVAGNGKQIFLQFPILTDLGVGSPAGSNVLFLRLDLAPLDSKFYSEEISVKTTKFLSFIVKRYSSSDLFASKIAAILGRTFRKGKDDLITFKGRDYFDLVWFLEKKIKPNYQRLEDITGKNSKEIFSELDRKVSLVKTEYLLEDLNPLFANREFVGNFCRNFQQIYKGLDFSFDPAKIDW